MINTDGLGDLTGLGGLVVIHSAASAKGPGFNSPIFRAYLRFNSRASKLTGKQKPIDNSL